MISRERSPSSADLPVVTFDLFSALLNSRSGGSCAFAAIGRRRNWSAQGTDVYDAWDHLNKAAQRDCQSWVPYSTLAGAALAECYDQLQLSGSPVSDLAEVLGTVPQWPLWSDVPAGLAAMTGRHRLGLLSNVDDAVFSSTRAAPFFDAEHVFTSQRLGVYKPNPGIYERTLAECGSLVHVASSARDVRGALEAGIRVIRLRRPGHSVDAAGPVPTLEVGSLVELESVLASPWPDDTQKRPRGVPQCG